mmetsp:Transcript_48899/g.110046  ORF Transcript_48899/g.110046 Transcript_48899/m.110046 type:complete len:206 (+) Transcript_48899:585-1202(+)
MGAGWVGHSGARCGDRESCRTIMHLTLPSGMVRRGFRCGQSLGTSTRKSTIGSSRCWCGSTSSRAPSCWSTCWWRCSPTRTRESRSTRRGSISTTSVSISSACGTSPPRRLRSSTPRCCCGGWAVSPSSSFAAASDPRPRSLPRRPPHWATARWQPQKPNSLSAYPPSLLGVPPFPLRGLMSKRPAPSPSMQSRATLTARRCFRC